jgi:2'-5' RNA ligase
MRVPAAAPAVSRHRDRYDAAARVGVPAHVTVAYPFKPTELLTSGDLDELTRVFARFRPVELTFAGTAWFGDEVLYLEPSDPRPLLALTDAIVNAFPEYPIYEGAYKTVHPHLTVGHATDRAASQAVERDVLGFPLSDISCVRSNYCRALHWPPVWASGPTPRRSACSEAEPKGVLILAAGRRRTFPLPWVDRMGFGKRVTRRGFVGSNGGELPTRLCVRQRVR